MRARASRDSSRTFESANYDWQEKDLRRPAPSISWISLIRTLNGQDIQFYREASDVQFDETGNRKRKYRYGDEDEIEMEQQERKRRQMLNKEFKGFSERIAEAAVNSVRIPYHRTLFLLTGNPSDWRGAGARYSVPRAIVRGRSLPNECSTATHNRMSGPSV